MLVKVQLLRPGDVAPCMQNGARAREDASAGVALIITTEPPIVNKDRILRSMVTSLKAR